jgi:hypothetical protein
VNIFLCLNFMVFITKKDILVILDMDYLTK